MKNYRFAIVGISLVLIVLTGTVKAQSITIDLNTEYQSVTGFGGMNMPGWIDDLTEDQSDKAFGNKPGQIGLSILRIRVPNSTTQFFREVPTAVRAKNHGAIVFATPWSPPAALKINNNLVGGYLLPQNYGAFTDHLLGFASYMNDNGAPLYAVSIQNEPDYQVTYESCDWRARQMIDFLKQQGVKFTTLKLIAAESFQFRRPITDSILNDPEAVQHVDIIGGHIYGGGLFDYPLARQKGKEIWMTEHLTGSGSPELNTWSLALSLATEISDCMKANFNAYVWWYIRRFYGPIDDAGNLTKKGYVMSQFSKYIRPGALRINAVIASAPNVDATAYKTDTSLVIVVINRNTTSINLDFTIQNGNIDTLTKFTTSATKNVVNDGGISVSGGTFDASLDASSITTFASYAGNGGKYGNIPPVANAGPDIKVVDTDGNGIEPVMLNGTGSTDPDGEIVNYSWSLNGFQVTWGSTYELDTEIGEYEVILTVTDNDGATHSDTLRIAVNSLKSTEIWLEAECGQVGSSWKIPSDVNASNGKYVTSPSGTQSLVAPSENTTDLIVFPFHLSEEGFYKLWGRVITPTADDDSYWIRMDDDSNWALWNSIPSGGTWHWDDVHDQANNSEVMVYDLDTGYHALTICYREDGTFLDKLLLTNTGAVPTGLGNTAINCDITSTRDQNVISYSEFSPVLVYPNPAKDEIQVSWSEKFNSLVIFSMDGRIMFEKRYYVLLQDTNLNLNLEQGIYFILLGNEKTSGIAKLVIED